jgi:hypothetical protein
MPLNPEVERFLKGLASVFFYEIPARPKSLRGIENS